MKQFAADMFCGCGGTSAGLLRAATRLGVHLELCAVNHWVTAIETHRANHPGVMHLCETLEKVDPKEAVPGGKLTLLVASPECVHFSAARGGKPMSDQSRHGARHILSWAKALDIESILIENVKEFRTWGPLNKDNRPIKAERGKYFMRFLRDLEALGYKVEHQVLCAADYGDATTRRRLFIIARKRGEIVWHQPTHMDPSRESLFAKGLKPWKAAKEIINWNIKGKSIFGRKRELVEKTLTRTLIGFERHGGPNAWPFAAMIAHHMQSLGFEIPATKSPLRTSGPLVDNLDLVVPLRNHGVAATTESPLTTVCAEGQHQAFAQGFVLPHRKFKRMDVDAVDVPLRTMDATNGHQFYLVEPNLIRYQGGKGSRATRTQSIGHPISTVDTNPRFGLVEPILVHLKGESFALVECRVCVAGDQGDQTYRYGLVDESGELRYLLDITLRMLTAEELAAAHSIPGYILVGTLKERIKQLGNMVPASIAEALCYTILSGRESYREESSPDLQEVAS